MKILITGAGGNVGKGLIERLTAEGHTLVLHDVNRLPDEPPFAGLPFVQGDAQAGIGLERAAAGCEMIVHLPAWHGIHWGQRTEADFWRLNVDGTFWAFQAAQSAGIKRVVFLSSMAWHGHYDKYGFTKRVGEELCEYNRRNHAIRYVAVRPADFTPWHSFIGYGERLLRGGVDREDVLDCIAASVRTLSRPPAGEPEGIIVNALRPNAFTAEQADAWEQNPLATCEAIFPGSAALVEKYAIDIRTKPALSDLGDGASAVGYTPTHHFGTFLDELRRLDSTIGPEAVKAMRCPY